MLAIFKHVFFGQGIAQGGTQQRDQVGPRPSADYWPDPQVSAACHSQGSRPERESTVVKVESKQAASPQPHPCSHMASRAGSACEELPSDGMASMMSENQMWMCAATAASASAAAAMLTHQQKFLIHYLAAYILGAQA